jgi:hypothetical protein
MTASILLLGVMLFNLFGYRLMVVYMQRQADRALEARLDSESYDESSLISIKVPVHRLSYYNTSTQFERADGSIELSGIVYKYVKRRLYNDSLEMMCIPNQTVNNLKAFKNEFFSFVNGLQQTSKDKRHGALPSLNKFPSADTYTDEPPVCSYEPPLRRLTTYFHYRMRMTAVHLATDERPPSFFRG